MVESSVEGDGVHRPVHYASFRTDKAASPGYSSELIAKDVDQKYFDDLDSIPPVVPGIETLLQTFERNLAEDPNAPFLGTREKQPDGSYSNYKWKTRAEVDKDVKDLAKGLMAGGFCPEVDGEAEG